MHNLKCLGQESLILLMALITISNAWLEIHL